jgi:hypothetical protein
MMDFPKEQVEELKKITPDLSIASEGGYTYILINKLFLPEGCIPAETTALLCPTPKDGYASRLFFPTIIRGCPSRNWNGNLRVLDRNWHAFSWRVPGNLRLAETLLVHLNALK